VTAVQYGAMTFCPPPPILDAIGLSFASFAVKQNCSRCQRRAGFLNIVRCHAGQVLRKPERAIRRRRKYFRINKEGEKARTGEVSSATGGEENFLASSSLKLASVAVLFTSRFSTGVAFMCDESANRCT
jgi:hypothetical protein